ncbi:MAG TPA: hypothetical protein VFO94_09395, partial [Gammaproteobacteria bacterium]|nr:hypothetical protein [Gammaproteobacteria bacterium]
RRAVAGYLTGLAAGIAYLFLAHESYDSAQLALGTGTTPLHDFQAFFFPTGVATLRAEPVAEGFLYPPSAALFFAVENRTPVVETARSRPI